jgi:hypothetical protein
MKKPFLLWYSLDGIIKSYSSLMVILFTFLLILLIFSPLFIWGNLFSENSNNILGIYSLAWSVLVSFVAVVLYFKKDKDNFDDYLIQNIEIVDVSNYQKIRTSLFNPTPFDREIYFSCLIITKEGADILKEVNSNLRYTFTSTNSFSELLDKNILINNDFAFIPITYYFEENINVGNEKLLFEFLIDSDLNGQNTNNYNVRFFVFRPKSDSNSYHRSVSAVFKAQNLTMSFSDLFIKMEKSKINSKTQSIKNKNE